MLIAPHRRRRASPLGWILFIILIGYILLAYRISHAATDTYVNLPAICYDSTPPSGTQCAQPLVFDVPAPTTIVKGAGGYFAAWSGFSAPGGVAYVCTAPVARGTPESGCPSADTIPYAQVYKDPSKLSASVVAGVAPLSTVLTWDVAGVDSCVASGSWTGAKLAKGTQTVTGLTANATYALTCSAGASTPGKAQLTWSPPTKNVDGSTLTDLAGYRIVYGLDPTTLTNIVQVPTSAASSYTIDGLTAGQTWYFAMRSYTATGAESSTTGTAQKTIAGSPGRQWTQSVAVAVSPAPTIPNPPTGLTVTEVTAYRLDQQPNAPKLVAIGTVPLRTRCYPERLLDKYRVDNATVKLAPNKARPNVALATCSVS